MPKPAFVAALLLLATASVASETIVVDSVVSGSPAAAAGLQDGDHLVRLAGKDIGSHGDLQKVMAEHEPGDTVPLSVRRDGEAVELSLTFGERPDGGVSIGVRLAIMTSQAPGGSGHGTPGEPNEATAECLGWIDRTYRIEAEMSDLGLDLADDHKNLLDCVKHDTSRMAPADAVRYCDNIFKVHCSALDVLTEIGEAQVQRCESRLGESLGLQVNRHDAWNRCAEQIVFDRYSREGLASDESACRAALLDECGTNVESAAQPGFASCCTAETLDRDACPMIDDGFTRGPCHDRPVCVNRLTSEWIECAALD